MSVQHHPCCQVTLLLSIPSDFYSVTSCIVPKSYAELQILSCTSKDT